MSKNTSSNKKEKDDTAISVENTSIRKRRRKRRTKSKNMEENTEDVKKEDNNTQGLLGNLNDKSIRFKIERYACYLEHDEKLYPIDREVDLKSIDLERAKKIISDSNRIIPENSNKMMKRDISSTNPSEESLSSDIEEEQENITESNRTVHFEIDSSEDADIESSEQLQNNKNGMNSPSYFFTGTKKIYVVALVSFTLGWLMHTNQIQILVDKLSNTINLSHILELVWASIFS